MPAHNLSPNDDHGQLIMCGRFALALQADEVEQLDGYPALRVDQWVNRDRYVPRYNVAPRTHAPVVRRARPEEPALVMQSMRWGLVPHWSKAEPPTLNTINARAENLEEGGGMWGSIKGRKRCVVVAQGYYEWLKKGAQRVPHFTRHSDKRLMLFAGLYDSATLDGQSEPLWTFTIVTTAASSSFAWLHDRQPVILNSQESLDRWLDTSTQTWDPKLNRLFDPYNDSDSPLECYAVPGEVGKVGVESPTFIEPVQKRKDGIEAMFMRQAKAKESASAAVAGTGNKRKHEPVSSSSSPSPSPAEVKDETGTPVAVTTAFPTSPSPSLSPAKRVKTEKRDPIKPMEIVDVDAREPAEDHESSSDIEILSSPPVGPPPSSQPVAKPKAKKIERENTPLSSGSQQRQQPSSSSQTASKKKPDPAVTTSPRKKKEAKKTEPSSGSTPKITSFFAKSAG